MKNKDLMPIPQVLLVDCANDVKADLIRRRYSVSEATFGKNIVIEYDRFGKASLPLLFNVPQNIQEYEVIVVDMFGVDKAINMSEIPEDHNRWAYFSVEPPHKTFYSLTMSSKLMFDGDRKPPKAIYIIFEGDYFKGQYLFNNVRKKTAEIATGYSYDFLKNIIAFDIKISRKNGYRTATVVDHELCRILSKYNSSFAYYVTFEHPFKYDSSINQSTTREDFCPLVLNDSNEIISFICKSEDNLILVLPQTKRKRELISELLEEYLPTIVPEFFPESTKFLWLSDQKYALPNANAFEERKQVAQIEYEAKLKRIDEEIKENNKQFGFLHDLLKQTDDLLVKAVIAWFEWLGFQNVIDVDQAKGTKQEDINIIEDDFVIIAEVKGIGGTSTDSECSQISKHRRKHEEASKGKEIRPIYIVNHQRFISPELRNNPPFTKDQIDYAVNDERGLVTTYQLFTWYKLVSKGLFSKDEVREVLRQLGSIPLIPPNYKLLGTIKEYLPKPNAFIIDLDNVEIKAGKKLLFVKGLDFQKADIQSLQDQGKPVQGISNGEAGVVVDARIGKGYSVYLCPKIK